MKKTTGMVMKLEMKSEICPDKDFNLVLIFIALRWDDFYLAIMQTVEQLQVTFGM